MKREDNIKGILREDGLEKPSDEFSTQLTSAILQKYERKPIEEFETSRWLGKIILCILVACNVWLLFRLVPFSVDPVLITSITAFILGFWGVIRLTIKAQSVKGEFD